MNGRIKEISAQAEKFTDFTHLDTVMNGERSDWHDIFREKFAELIVNECVSVLKEESERLYKLASEEKDELFANNFEICAKKCWDNEEMIKQHFGVK